MEMNTNPIQILKNEKVRKYFLGVFESNLTALDKYERVIDFFTSEEELKRELLNYGSELRTGNPNEVKEIISKVGKKTGIWNPEEIQRQTRESIERAVQRLKVSQHRDGGWGFEVEKSGVWGTAFTVLCLDTVKQFQDMTIEVGEMLERGKSWLEKYSHDWRIEQLKARDSRSVYEVCIVIRCFYETGITRLEGINEWVERLYKSQNTDGGWDASIWSGGPTNKYSEVGATSSALRALSLAANRPDNYRDIFASGIKWLLEVQNQNGSWNNKSCLPGRKGVAGEESISKTSDAVTGIIASRNLLKKKEAANLERKLDQAIHKAVVWLTGQERLLHDEAGNITGWGWGTEVIGDTSIPGLENTCLTLETFFEIKTGEVSLPLMTANAQWLIRHQYKNEGDIEDGKWEPYGHTARIALSLCKYYEIIKQSPLFDNNEKETKTA
jgi:hypothetical protein